MALQRAAGAAMGALLYLVGEGADHQIATEAQRCVPVMRPPPGKPQLVRGSVLRGNLDAKAYCLTEECYRAVEHCLTEHVPVASLISARAEAPLSSYSIQITCCGGPCGVVGEALASSKRSGKSTGLP